MENLEVFMSKPTPKPKKQTRSPGEQKPLDFQRLKTVVAILANCDCDLHGFLEVLWRSEAR